MSQIQDRIAQFRKMANDDPDNELGHYRLGQLLLEDGQYDEAVASFKRTLELSPQFSKVYQLLGSCLIKMGRPEDAVRTLTEGFAVADQRGDNIPRDEISKLLVQLGQPAPTPTRTQPSTAPTAGSFHCQRPGCVAGGFGRQLPRPPMNDELGKRIYESVCADCWEYWLRNLSIKVINEMRLDLGDEKHVETYDQVMRETLGPIMSALPDLLARPDAALQYVVSFGGVGVGVFTAAEPLHLQRGARVVIHSPRGIEAGSVRCRATPGQVRLLGPAASGPLLRVLSSADDARLHDLQQLAQRVFDRSRQHAIEHGFSLEVLDVEILLDGKQAVLQFVGDEPRLEDFAQALAGQFDLDMRFENLAQPATPDVEEHADEHGGCGKPDCGRTEGGTGGCTTCSTGGGCSSSCGVKVDMRDYFGHLREKMEKSPRRSLV